jgi:hypothetical protein
MYRKKVMTTELAILAIVMAIALITASTGGSGFVTSAFAVKKDSGKSGTSSGGKSGSSTSTGGSSTGSKSKFIKCVTAISGSPSKAEVDNCWDQVFGSGSGLTLGSGGSSSSTTSGRAGSGSSGHAGTPSSGSST